MKEITCSENKNRWLRLARLAMNNGDSRPLTESDAESNYSGQSLDFLARGSAKQKAHQSCTSNHWTVPVSKSFPWIKIKAALPMFLDDQFIRLLNPAKWSPSKAEMGWMPNHKLDAIPNSTGLWHFLIFLCGIESIPSVYICPRQVCLYPVVSSTRGALQLGRLWPGGGIPEITWDGHWDFLTRNLGKMIPQYLHISYGSGCNMWLTYISVNFIWLQSAWMSWSQQKGRCFWGGISGSCDFDAVINSAACFRILWYASCFMLFLDIVWVCRVHLKTSYERPKQIETMGSDPPWRCHPARPYLSRPSICGP